MGIIDRIRAPLQRLAAAPALASPWAEYPNHLKSPIIAAEILDFAPRTVTRELAISVPALSRARLLIVSTIPRLPLVATMPDGAESEVPRWLTHTSGALSPFHRMLWTVDDLFFYGWSLWAVERDEDGDIEAAARVPYEQWNFDADGNITVGDNPVSDEEVILIPGTGEGILTFGANTLTEALNISHAIQRAAETPAAQIELHQTNEATLTQEQVRELIAAWAKARRGENGGVAYTSNGIEVREHGAAQEHLLIDGRNAAAVDIARHAGIPATMIDATLKGSSLSYQNTAARMAELITFGLAPLMAAVSARLSQDDVTPAGVTLAFDATAVIESLQPTEEETATTETPEVDIDDPFDERK